MFLRCKYNEEYNFVFEKNGYKIFECKDCHAQFCELTEDEDTYLKKVYSDAYFTEGKDGYPDYMDEKSILIQHGRWYAHIIEEFISPGTMLDVGAAAGFLMLGFKEHGWTCTGLEPNLHMTEYGKQNLGLHMVQGDIEHYKVPEKYDLVSMIQVIGHIFNLNQALYNTSNLINQNGILLIESWDRGSAAAKFCGRKWHEYSPPSVINYYTKKSLNSILERHGFKLLKIGRPKKQISLKHALSLASKEYKLFNSIKKLTDKVLKKKDIFLIYPPVDLFYAIYQKQSKVNETIAFS